MTPPSPLPAPPEGTRAALVAAAVHLFGTQGFAATSTRQIAAQAGANLASIAYHFGGKDGLRLACGEEFARRMRGDVLAGIAAFDDPAPILPPAAAAAALETLLRRLLALLFAPDAQDSVTFMLREIAEEGPAMRLVFESLVDPAHRRVCALWQAATGQDADSESVRLRAFALMGQAVYFRLARPLVCRRLGWDGLGPAEVDRLAATLADTLRLMLSEAPG